MAALIPPATRPHRIKQHLNKMKTVIFDMDGLLINSEPMWKSAEKQVFESLGVPVNEALATITAAMTTREVTEFWYGHYPWQNRSLEQAENDVIDCVADHIKSTGVAMPGVNHALELFHRHQFKIGLATNAPSRLITVVLEKLAIESYFQQTVSSDQVSTGKPDPAVYLLTLAKLNSKAETTIAIEDSISGIRAAKSAGIKTIAIPAEEQFAQAEFELADHKFCSLTELNDERLESII